MQIHAVSFKSYRGSIRYIGFVWHTASQALLQSMYICSHKKNRTSTNKVRNMLSWWSVSGSNRWPPACKAGALPAELTPHVYINSMVGLNGLEPTTSPLSGVRSNHLSYRPVSIECSYIIPLLFSCVNKVFIIFIIMIIELCNPVILPMQPIVDPVLQAYFMIHTAHISMYSFPLPHCLHTLC